jgi:ABC-type lipoprotein release transport system permease subunit
LLVDEALLTSVEVEQVEEKPYPSEPVEEEFKEAFNDESELASKENEEQATIKISKDEVIDTKASQYELIALLAFLLLVIATIYVARRNSTLRKRSRLQIK